MIRIAAVWGALVAISHVWDAEEISYEDQVTNQIDVIGGLAIVILISALTISIKVRKYMRNMSDLKKQVEDLKKQVEESRGTNSELEKQLEQSHATNSNLKQQLADLTDQLEESHATYADTADQLQESHATNSELTRKLQVLFIWYSVVDAEFRQCASINSGLKKKLEESHETKSDLNDQLQESQAINSDLTDQLKVSSVLLMGLYGTMKMYRMKILMLFMQLQIDTNSNRKLRRDNKLLLTALKGIEDIIPRKNVLGK